jgi:hypothetical protein
VGEAELGVLGDARRGEALVEGGQAMAEVREAEVGLVAAQTAVDVEEPVGVDAEAAFQGSFGAVVEIVKMLCTALKGVARTSEDALGAKTGETLAGAEELIAASAEQTLVEAVEARFDVVLGGGDELGGCGRGGSAEVCGGVGEDRVCSVTDAGEDGDGAGVDGAADELVVKAVEVFPGTAAAGDKDDVDDAAGRFVVGALMGRCQLGRCQMPVCRAGTEPADTGGDFAGTVRALNGCGIDE